MAKNPDKDKKKIIVLLASAVVIVTVAIAGVKLQWFGNSGDKVEPINDGIQQEAFYDAEEPQTVEEQYKQAIETVGQSVIESQTPDIQEVTGVDEDGAISYVTPDGDSGILERDTSYLEEEWGVSKEEIEANEKNMSEEEFIEWMMKMDEESIQRRQEAAKKEEEATKTETVQEVQQPQQETQTEVKQPQQEIQESQEQSDDRGVDYNDDGSITLHTDAGIDVVIGGGELSVPELTDFEK
ncbi:MAG: hypothetical protein IKN81_01250 [Oscillospiraceae bacterium]|nr:hypothetical protein [Oscillospiraceae bacterium]